MTRRGGRGPWSSFSDLLCRAALVVLQAGGSEAQVARCVFCSSGPGQHWLCSGLVGQRQRRQGVFLLLLFMARTAPVVLLAGGVEAAATRCLSSALVGQGCTGCAPGWWVGEGATKVSSSALLGQSSIGVLLAGGAEAVAMSVFSSSDLQGQGSTDCAPGWRNGGKGDDGGVFFCSSKPGRHWLCS